MSCTTAFDALVNLVHKTDSDEPIRHEDADKSWDQDEVKMLSQQPTRGVECLVPPPGTSNIDLWENYVAPKVRELVQSGKRIIHRPAVTPDGVFLEWVMNHAVKEEPIHQPIQDQSHDDEKVVKKDSGYSSPINIGGYIHVSGTGQREDPMCLESDDEPYTPNILPAILELRYRSPDDPNDFCAVDQPPVSPVPPGLCVPDSTGIINDHHEPAVAEHSQTAPSPLDTTLTRTIASIVPEVELGHQHRSAVTRNQSSDSEDGDDSSSSDASTPQPESGPSKPHPYLDNTDDYNTDLLAGGETSRQAILRLKREGKLPAGHLLGPSLQISTQRQIVDPKGKGKAVPISAKPSSVASKSQHVRTVSSTKRPSAQSSNVHGEAESSHKRRRISSSRGSMIPPAIPSSSSVRERSPDFHQPSYHEINRVIPNRRASLPRRSVAHETSEMADEPFSSDTEEVEHEHVRQRLKSDDGHTIGLPKPSHARARRLIATSDSNMPVACIYMRSDAQFINRRHLYRIKEYSLPSPEDERRTVSDACLVAGHISVLGYEAGPSDPKISVIPLGNVRPRRTDIYHMGHSRVSENISSGTVRPFRGISSLTSIGPGSLQFLSGGHDHTIRLWTLKLKEGRYTGKSVELSGGYMQKVQSIVYRASDSLIFSGGSNNIYTTCLPTYNIQRTDKLSNPLVQVNVNMSNNSLVFLELDHLDHQIALYDTRRGFFSRRPCLDFGYREPDATFSKRHGRYFHKGSVEGNLYARGYMDGTVCVWDIRNTNNAALQLTRKCERAVVHTIISGNVVMAYGDATVACWDMRSGMHG